MGKQPHNEHELELALTRLAGSNLAAVEYRDIMAGVILGQMLPQGCVAKGDGDGFRAVGDKPPTNHQTPTVSFHCIVGG